ncbi:chromosome segregation ATPase [Paenibacillus amylolyticus]|uniref:Chromosome segregation ATPase n=1 Tax=Paenibacillus amylolyticus TaxID=1451 RepID=A0AAP5LP02_PAEAM|nr:hypothetical protein [Paenibacillus amylolyticus]MDR6726262.1 chromosome segregation ATPase [Paenibacillus amylolyticus]
MTYSQRSTHAAASSDITYLVYQIGQTEEHLKEAEENIEVKKQQLEQHRASALQDREVYEEVEIQLMDEIAQQQTVIETIRKRLAELDEELALLGD